VIELCLAGAQTGFDVAQTLAVSQLRESHAQKLIEMRELERWISTRISGYALMKRVQRQVLHELGKYQFPCVHMQSPDKFLTNVRSFAQVKIDCGKKCHLVMFIQ
jgi:hypothetical protein